MATHSPSPHPFKKFLPTPREKHRSASSTFPLSVQPHPNPSPLSLAPQNSSNNPASTSSRFKCTTSTAPSTSGGFSSELLSANSSRKPSQERNRNSAQFFWIT